MIDMRLACTERSIGATRSETKLKRSQRAGSSGASLCCKLMLVVRLSLSSDIAYIASKSDAFGFSHASMHVCNRSTSHHSSQVCRRFGTGIAVALPRTCHSPSQGLAHTPSEAENIVADYNLNRTHARTSPTFAAAARTARTTAYACNDAHELSEWSFRA